jgi:hypothetical protein
MVANLKFLRIRIEAESFDKVMMRSFQRSKSSTV